MATGVLPFIGDAAIGTVARVGHGNHIAARMRNPDVPESLDQIIERCLRRSPEERYRSAREVHEALVAASASARVARSASIVVVPFENSTQDPELEYLSDGSLKASSMR
jgi:serine/threonine protein kinase